MRIVRLLEIILLLLNNNVMSGKQLSEKLEVSIRTIQRDIITLTMSGVPIVANTGSKGGYTILDGYKLRNNERERHVLGEWIFSWVLNGKVIQDVWICPSRKERVHNPQTDGEYGTTIRFFNKGNGMFATRRF